VLSVNYPKLGAVLDPSFTKTEDEMTSQAKNSMQEHSM